MAEFSKPLAIALMLALTGTAQAQDAGAPAEDQATADAEAAPSETTAPEVATEAAPAEADPNAPGTPYVAETKGDWQVQCVRTADGNDPCQLYQLLNDEAGNSVAEISLFNLPGGQQAAAGATIVTPLETLLTRNITMRVDNSEPKVYPFTFCTRVGCVARIGFTQAEINGFKRGNVATLTIVPLAAPDEKVDLKVSLSGFTAGFDAIVAANAKAQQPAQN